MAMRNSARALGGSCFISATPPKRKSVMPLISMPFRRATSECDSSWRTMETKSPSIPATAMIQCVAGARSG